MSEGFFCSHITLPVLCSALCLGLNWVCAFCVFVCGFVCSIFAGADIIDSVSVSTCHSSLTHTVGSNGEWGVKPGWGEWGEREGV